MVNDWIMRKIFHYNIEGNNKIYCNSLLSLKMDNTASIDLSGYLSLKQSFFENRFLKSLIRMYENSKNHHYNFFYNLN